MVDLWLLDWLFLWSRKGKLREVRSPDTGGEIVIDCGGVLCSTDNVENNSTLSWKKGTKEVKVSTIVEK